MVSQALVTWPRNNEGGQTVTYFTLAQLLSAAIVILFVGGLYKVLRDKWFVPEPKPKEPKKSRTRIAASPSWSTSGCIWCLGPSDPCPQPRLRAVGNRVSDYHGNRPSRNNPQ